MKLLRNKFFHLGNSFFPLLFTLCLSLSAHALSCRELMDGLVAREDAGFTDRMIAPSAGVRDAEPTIKKVGEKTGQHGGKRILVEKTGARWASNFATFNFDPQGDPRWIIEILGLDAAEFLGFEVVNDQKIYLPDYHEIQGAIAKINAELKREGKEEILLDFYLPPGSGNSSVVKYARRYVDELKIPLAPEGNHSFHDLSFHTGAIFLPKVALEFSAERMRFEMGFYDFLREKYKNDAAISRAVQEFSWSRSYRRTLDIDNGTGLINPAAAEFAQNKKTGVAITYTFEYPLRRLMFYEMSSAGPIVNAFSFRRDREFPYGASPPHGSEKARQHPINLIVYPADQEQMDFNQYRRTYRSRSPLFDPDEGYQDEMKQMIQDACHAMIEKIANVKAAILTLKAKNIQP
jgi:hypothetical protein